MGFAAVCVASVFFALFSIFSFGFLYAPLTYTLLQLAGGLSHMASSINSFATPLRLAGVFGLPVVYLGLVFFSNRWRGRAPRTAILAKIAGAILLATVVTFARRGASLPAWTDRPDRLLSRSAALGAAVVFRQRHDGGRRRQLGDDFPVEYLSDFQTVGHGGPAPVEAAALLPERERPKNVIVIVLESTPTKYLGLYGSPYPTTPHLQAEAAHAILFDRYYSHIGLTANSLLSATLGIYPGLVGGAYTNKKPDLPGVALPQVLKPLGYRSAFISSGDNEFLDQDKFLDHRGFDTVWDYRNLGSGKKLFSWGCEDKLMFDAILGWIDQTRSHDRTQPFYIMGWTQQTHHPYESAHGVKEIDFFAGVPTEKQPLDVYDLNQYLNCLKQVDEQMGRLFDGLRSRGLADDTIVMLTGDHGEAFGDPHPTVFGHGTRIFEENVRVPMMIWNPQLFTKTAHSDTAGGHVDLSPTVLDLLGLPLPQAWQGRSLFDPAKPPRSYFYACNSDLLFGVREENWKYIYNLTLGRDELYDLSADPAEQKNVAADHAEKCHTLKQRLAAWVSFQNEHFGKLMSAPGVN